jgi:Zn-dependent membrane protease YugP
MYYYPMDWTYLLVLIGAAISAVASMNVNGTFRRYSGVRNRRNLTGKDIAELILRGAGITDVRVEHISGNLTDHYSPGEKVLRLSDQVYNSTSVSAVGVAAHECGHAVQHQVGYFPLHLRSASVPIANIGSRLSWPIILIGLLFGITGLARIGVFLFTFVVLFQLITLPVEFDASHRALKILDEYGYLDQQEMGGARKVLTAAALTYVAALFSSILQLLRLFLLTQGGRRRR